MSRAVGSGTGLLVLRAVAVTALLLLLWNPARSRSLPGAAQSVVLLDASLSLSGGGSGTWAAALDTARRLGRDGIVWRFGAQVAAYDSGAPADGASLLAPALEAAAARGGPITIVTDGLIADVAALPPDLRRRPRVVVLPRADFRDAFVARVAGPRRVGGQDTVRLAVSFGQAGPRRAGAGAAAATLAVRVGGRTLASRAITLPDSGILNADLAVPAARLQAGWNALDVRLDGVNDAEPRDDARLLLVEVSPQPAAVIVAAPPDWDSRFLARTLGDVARVPVKVFTQAERDGAWRDGTTLAPVAAGTVSRVVAGARLVVLAGDPAAITAARRVARGAVLFWSTTTGRDGDWYVQPPPASPLAGMLADLAWDSMPPASSIGILEPEARDVVALTATAARRGLPQPIVLLREGGAGGGRQATVAAGGLWRWSLRGGAAELAYRSLVASLADWLLGGAGSVERFVPVAYETPQGLPLRWRWTGSGASRPVALGLTNVGGETAGERRDTLRFDPGGFAELHLPPGVYRYAARDGGVGAGAGAERGLVAVETYSDEWRPAARTLSTQPGEPAARSTRVGLRDRWWVFALVIAALATEWAWRRRLGLP